MVLLASDFDQSRYLKAADLGEIGSEKRFKIKTVTKRGHRREGKKRRLVVWFTNSERGLVLNKTNLPDSARRLW